MKKRLVVWILQTGEPMPLPGSSGRPMRAMLLAKELEDRGHRVVLWTADFEHITHKHFFGYSNRVSISDNLEVRTVHSRGYQGNTGIARLVDHAQLARRLHGLLQEEQTPPDVAFVGFPPIEAAYEMSGWLQQRKVPFLLDVKDQWPDVLHRAFPSSMRPLARFGLAPYSWMAKRCMQRATGISTISDPFLDWCLKTAQLDEDDPAHAVYPLTVPAPECSSLEIEQAKDKWDELGILDDNKVRVAFVGSLSSSFDFSPVRLAAAQENTEFVICGSGNDDQQIRGQLGDLGNVHFPGRVNHCEAAELARRSTFALAPYKPLPDFQMSLPNKFFDALANGLPTLTSLEGELARVLDATGSGWSYGSTQDDGLLRLLQRLELDPGAVRNAAEAALRTYDEIYASDLVYSRLVDQLEALAAA